MFGRKPRLTSATIVVAPTEIGRAVDVIREKQNQYQNALSLFDELTNVHPQQVGYTIDYLLDVVKRDLQGDHLTRMIYSGIETISKLYPAERGMSDFLGIASQMGVNLPLVGSEWYSLAEKYIFTHAWNKSKLNKSINTIHNEDFIFDSSQQNGYYYKHMDYGYIVNGNHSISAGIRYRKGSVRLRLFDDSMLFDRLSSDGAYWIDTKNMRVIGETMDFRFALIYELSRRRYYLTRAEHEERG